MCIAWVPTEAREGVRSPGAGVTGFYELPYVCAGTEFRPSISKASSLNS